MVTATPHSAATGVPAGCCRMAELLTDTTAAADCSRYRSWAYRGLQPGAVQPRLPYSSAGHMNRFWLPGTVLPAEVNLAFASALRVKANDAPSKVMAYSALVAVTALLTDTSLMAKAGRDLSDLAKWVAPCWQ
jgi:hypothetical protein